MATLEDILIQVQEKLQDSSFSSDKLLGFINSGIRRCAHVVLLPELETTGTFVTSPTLNSVAIPVGWNFGRNLYGASVLNASAIQVLPSLGQLRDQAPWIDTEVRAGEVTYLTTRRGQLVYTSSPSVATIVVCKFYEAPTDLVLDTDEPSCLPLALQESLLVNFALWKSFEEIEDGIEGEKVNTSYYKSEFNDALVDLDFMFDSGRSALDPPRESSWI